MGYQQILTERHDDVLLLTLHRPERMNAWTPRMMAELTDAVSLANDDDSVGAIVVTGAGGGCADADIGANFADHVNRVAFPRCHRGTRSPQRRVDPNEPGLLRRSLRSSLLEMS